MKQTAVEWLIKELQDDLGWGVDLGGIDSEIYNQIVNKAKEMEKEQIIDARIDGDTWSTAIKEMRMVYAELYYTETFNTNEK